MLTKSAQTRLIHAIVEELTALQYTRTAAREIALRIVQRMLEAR